MGKISNYLGFITVMIILFKFAGITTESPISWALGFILDPSTWSTGSLLEKVGATIAAASAIGIVVGSLFRGTDPILLRAPMATFLIAVGWDIVSIYDVLSIVNASFALLICAPLMLVYVISMVEWWSGSST